MDNHKKKKLLSTILEINESINFLDTDLSGNENELEELRKRKKELEEEIKRLEEEEKRVELEVSEEVIGRFVGLLCISGFAVEYYAGLKFKIWVRGMPIEHAYIVFEINPETLTVSIESAAGEFSRYKQKKHKELFEKNIIGIYYRAMTEE